MGADALGVDADRVIIEEIIDVEEEDDVSVEEVKAKMAAIEKDTSAVEKILTTLATDLGVPLSSLELESGNVIETEGDAVKCGKNERVKDNACIECPAGTTRAAGDFQSGPDTTCKDGVVGSIDDFLENSVNPAVIFMVLCGAAFAICIVFELHKLLCSKKKDENEGIE